MTRLLVAGQAWDVSDAAFVGGRVVRLEHDGSWTEVFSSAKTGCSHLKEFVIGGKHTGQIVEKLRSALDNRRG